MRKSLLLLAALGSTAAFAAFAIPAAAESGEGSCAVGAASAEPLNLDATPSAPVTGKLRVQGVDHDECDDAPAVGQASDDGLRADMSGRDDAGSAEGFAESEDD